MDEWDTAHLDLPAYLARIHYTGDLAPSGQTLRALHRAHVAAIPFENLDIPLGRPVSSDLDDVQAKLVDAGRGGYCYEHAVLFAASLERLGYLVDRLLARIGDDPLRPRPRSHMALHVHTPNGGQWLADVGFGAGLLEPLPWGQTTPHTQGGWTYRLTPGPMDGWQLRERRGRQWPVLYSFTDEPQHASDIAVANHFTSTHPSSPFVGQLLAMHKDTDRKVRLHGRRLSQLRPDRSTSEREFADHDLGPALHEEFGLRLPRHELSRLIESLPPRLSTGPTTGATAAAPSRGDSTVPSTKDHPTLAPPTEGDRATVAASGPVITDAAAKVGDHG